MKRLDFYKDVKINLEYELGLSLKSWKNIDNGIAVRTDSSLVFVKITRNVVTVYSHGAVNFTNVIDYNKASKLNMVPITSGKIAKILIRGF